MLKHHGHARGTGGARIGGGMGLSGKEHPAIVGPHKAIDHLDQRRLAGPVFAQKRVDFPGLDREGHIVIGTHAGIGLAQALGPENVAHLRASFSYPRKS